MLSSYIDTDRYKVFDHTEQNSKVNEFLALLRTEEIQSFLKVFIDSAIATSELKILKRLAACEALLGLDDYSIDEEEHEPTIPEKILRLDETVKQLDKVIKPDLVDRSLIAPSKNITEIRADFLVEYMRKNKDMLPKAASPFENIDSRIMDSRDFKKFVENYLPEEFQPKSTKNIRKLKRDVFEAAEKRCSTNDIFIDKADHGRKELRLIFVRQIPDEELTAWLTGSPEQTVTA